jgi:outer membrane protein with beta-barrel domain
MRFLRFLPLTMALVLAAAPAHAMNWSLGANLGLAIVMPDIGDDVTVFGWPLDPGIRVGFLGDDPRHEFYVDTSLLMLSNGGTFRRTEITGNYQHNFRGSGSVSPYVTGGMGFVSVGVSNGGDVGATSVIFGGGVGIRHRMGNRHGVLRGEVRLDHVTQGDDGPVVLIEEANVLGIKLGFDFWDDPLGSPSPVHRRRR